MPSAAAYPLRWMPCGSSPPLRHSPGGWEPSASPSIIHASLQLPVGTGPRGPGFARKDKAPTPDSPSSESHLDFPKAHKDLLFLARRELDLLLMKGR